MLELGSGEQTFVRRLRLGARGLDPLTAALRARSAFAAVSLGSAGLPPRAVLCVRSLNDPRPRSCSFDPATLRVPREWRDRLGDELARLARAAVRPAREAVTASAESVLFADRAELLAALGADWSRGRAAERWWWRSLLGRAPDARTVAAAWERWAEYAPAALELLSRERAAAAFALSLTADKAEAILRRVVRAHALTDLANALAPLFGETRGAVAASAQPTAGFAVVSDAGDGAQARPPWHEHAPESADAAPDPARQSLLGVSLMIVRAPSAIRRAEFARRVLLWSRGPSNVAAPPDVERARAHAPRDDSAEKRDATADGPPNISKPVREPAKRDASDDAPRPDRRATTKPGARSRDVRPTQRVADDRQDDDEKVSATNAGEGFDERRAPTRAAVESREGGLRSRGDRGEEQRRASAREDTARSTFEMADGEAWETESVGVRDDAASSPLLEAEIETRFGGLFFLVNLGQYLGLYGDFTQPAAPGIALPLWDFVALVGRKLAGPRVERDAVWPLLARLAGRGAREEPGAAFDPSDEWRVPADWLKPFARDRAAWLWSVGSAGSTSQGRLRVLHPRGFFVIDVPLEESKTNSESYAEVERQLAREIEPYLDFVNAAHLIHAPRGLTVPWRAARTRWLGHVAAYSRARLRLALGAKTRTQIARRLVERRARVCVTATHVDVMMRLAELPVEVRFAGLDRDPGWVPAAGRYVAYHFD